MRANEPGPTRIIRPEADGGAIIMAPACHLCSARVSTYANLSFLTVIPTLRRSEMCCMARAAEHRSRPLRGLEAHDGPRPWIDPRSPARMDRVLRRRYFGD